MPTTEIGNFFVRRTIFMLQCTKNALDCHLSKQIDANSNLLAEPHSRQREMKNMTKKQTEKVEVSPTMEKSQEYFTTQIANSEKAVESAIEFNAAVFKGGEAIAKKVYDNYVSNVAAAFDGVKALNKTNDVADFYKVSTANNAAAAERLSEQGKSLVELSGKVLKETGEAGRLAYSKGFAVNV
ncbi:MAG: phasin family protein [Rhizobiaceae bacterium]